MLLEDDENLNRGIALKLQKEGYQVFSAFQISEAEKLFDENRIDLVISDITLPDGNGLEFCRKIRNKSKVFVLFLTAMDSEIDMVNGYDAGADDYLTKPFSVEELLARLRVTQRRLAMMQNRSQVEESVFTNGSLKIDYVAGCVYLNENELHLTPIEYKLLCLLSQNIGKVLTHTYITQAIWGSSWENDIASLRVFMATLRKKIESAPDSPQYIQTHIGVGYRMLRVE